VTAKRVGSAVVLLGSLTFPALLPSQQRVLDSGTLLVSHAGAIIGKEEFVVRAGRAAGDRGWTIAARIFHPAGRPQHNLAAVLELAADSQPASLPIDQLDPKSSQVYAELVPRRVSIRTVREAHESVRQYPAPGRPWLTDDSVFSLHAIPPAGSAGPVLLLSPRTGLRMSATWSDRGVEVTEVNGEAVSLRHILVSGIAPRDLWYDDRGRLIKVEVPTLGLTAVRARER
jgi:hypothetical protein